MSQPISTLHLLNFSSRRYVAKPSGKVMLCQLQGSTGTLPFAGVDWQTDNVLMLVEPCHWQGCHLKGCTGKVVISYARQSLPLAKLQWILDTPCNYAARPGPGTLIRGKRAVFYINRNFQSPYFSFCFNFNKECC